MLQIEEVVAMTERLKLGRHGAHDRDNGAIVEAIVNRAQSLDTRHDSSHIRSRVSNSATGLLDEVASVCACRIRGATFAASSRRMVGMRKAARIVSVTAPPSVCHGSRSPKVPRSLININ